jgi:hypothetical protein
MSLFRAINMADNGLTTQSSASGNLGGEVASSQTMDFKRVVGSLENYRTTSTQTGSKSGSIVAYWRSVGRTGLTACSDR